MIPVKLPAVREQSSPREVANLSRALLEESNKWRYGTFQASHGVIGANTTIDATFTDGIFTGIRAGAFVAVAAPALATGVIVAGARCVTDGQVIIRIANVTGAPVLASSVGTWSFVAVSP